MATKKSVGQPRKKQSWSEKDLDQVEALSSYLTTEDIADYMGICRTTFYAEMKRVPEIHERYKKGRAKCKVVVAKSLIDKARSGDTVAAIFYLKTQAGWREQQHETVETIQIEPVYLASDEETPETPIL